LRRNRPRRRKAVVKRGPSIAPMRGDERWSMDFMHDQLHDGRRLRVLTVVDQIHVHARGAGDRGAGIALRPRCDRRAQPAVEVASEAGRDPGRQRLGVCVAHARCVGLSRECEARLQLPPEADGQRAHRVVQRQTARRVPERARLRIARRRRGNFTSWRTQYTKVRPHSALGELTPREFAKLGQRNADRSWPEFLAARVASRRSED
jgi:putative transposase